MPGPPLKSNSWILYSSLGWVLGVVLVILISSPLELIGLGKTAVALGMTGGVSMAQWFVLRRESTAYRWVLASLVGMGIPFILLDLFRNDIPLPSEDSKMIATTAVGALFLSVLQRHWFLGSKVPMASWIVANLSAWLLALAVPFLLSVSRINSWHLPGAISVLLGFITILAGGPIIGWLTGVVLVRSQRPGDTVY